MKICSAEFNLKLPMPQLEAIGGFKDEEIDSGNATWSDNVYAS